mmetsp:Transcript_90499/g.251854  ORF Transcript_90499/g.251854 Transcript_90499/m.251854 type:complete len:294 (+) Transcript_90499:132-1013(+)
MDARAQARGPAANGRRRPLCTAATAELTLGDGPGAVPVAWTHAQAAACRPCGGLRAQPSIASPASSPPLRRTSLVHFPSRHRSTISVVSRRPSTSLMTMVLVTLSAERGPAEASAEERGCAASAARASPSLASAASLREASTARPTLPPERRGLAVATLGPSLAEASSATGRWEDAGSARSACAALAPAAASGVGPCSTTLLRPASNTLAVPSAWTSSVVHFPSRHRVTYSLRFRSPFSSVISTVRVTLSKGCHSSNGRPGRTSLRPWKPSSPKPMLPKPMSKIGAANMWGKS